MKTKTVKTSGLKPHPDNPNRHPKEQIKELQNSIDQFDQVKNIVVWQGKVIAGNGFLEAAKKKGLEEIEIKDVSGWPEERAIKFMIADNRLAECAIMDDDLLAGLISDMDDPLEIPGIDERFLDELTGNIPTEKIEPGEGENDNIIIRLEIISKTWAEHSEDILENIQAIQKQYKGFKFQVKE